MNLVDLTLNDYLVFTLVLLRMSGLVVFAPFFGGENLPHRARIGLAVFLSFLAFTPAKETLAGMPLPLSLVDLALLGAREVLVGLALGYAAGFLFAGAQMAGELVGQQIGFDLASVVDPLSEQEVGLLSFFQFTVAIMVFLAVNAHLWLLRVLALSYGAVGLGQAVLRGEMVGHLVWMFGQIWEAALQTGGPVLLVMMMVSVLVGFLVRTMPQMNIMVVGLPTRTFLGLLALGVAVYPFVLTVRTLCARMLEDVGVLVALCGPAAG